MITVAMIKPVVGAPDIAIEKVASMTLPGIRLLDLSISDGPESIETEADVIVGGKYLIDAATAAVDAGADAIVINCMADPCLYAIRELLSVPVVGAGEAALQWAFLLDARAGWIDVAASSRNIVERQCRLYGTSRAFTAFDSLELSPTQLHALSPASDVFEKLVSISRRMIREADVNAIILGCSALDDLRTELEQRLNNDIRASGGRVHVIAAVPLAASTAAALARTGLRHF